MGSKMRKLIIKTICVALIVITMIGCISTSVNSYSVDTYSTYNNCDDVTMLRNENQIYLIGHSDNNVYIDAIYPQSYSITLTLNNNVYSYNLCGDTLVLVCPIKESEQNEVVLYNIESDSFTSFNTTDGSQHEKTQIAYSNGYVYLSDHYGNIKQYTTKGKLCNEYKLGKNACFLMTDYSENVYATSQSGIYRLSDNSCAKISSTAIGTAAQFIDDNTLVSANGYTYRLRNSSVNKLISFRHTLSHPSGGIYKKSVITSQDNTIYAINTAEDKAIKSISLSDNIEQLYVINDTIVAQTYCNGGVTISMISYSELSDIKTSDDSDIYLNSDNSNSELKHTDYTISSYVYKVDNENYTISSIAPATTVAQFKRNMIYDGFNVEFVKYGGQNITSGSVGTATIAKFYNDSFVYEYELCVEGDLTGEGNVNTRDEAVMFDCLLDNMEVFSGVFVDAANLHNDDELTVADLVLLLRMIESNK